ncbi:PAS domain S-box protein [Granulosicoccus sp. 3-233]|uniref:PAS domain S-box protein n=1 Tax=Granulosicoccus sp. 3-233 TaxID=3417969 RepID=UPI003D327200
MRSLRAHIENVPLTRLLVLAFATILLCAIAIIVLISFYFADRIMSSVAEQAARNSALEIQSRTERFLTIADQTIKGTAQAFSAGRVSIDAPDTLSRFLWDQAQHQNAELVSDIYFASEQGHIMSISVPDLQASPLSPRVKFASPDTEQLGLEYLLAATGSLDTISRRLMKIDPRTRPWYRQAVDADGTPVWSDVYQDYDSEHLMLTRSVTVKDDDGVLLGVAAIDMSLSHFRNFLQSLNIDEKGGVFLFNEQGQLLASTHGNRSPIRQEADAQTEDSADPLTRTAYEFLSESTATTNLEGDSDRQTIRLAGQDGYLFKRPIGQQSGVDWTLIMFLPTTDFLESAGKQSHVLLPLIFIVVLIGIAFMLGFLQLVITPLKSLTADARKIAAGQFDVPITSDSANEVGELSRSIANMQQRLKTSIAHLKDANLLLKRENHRIETTLGSLDDGVITFDVDGNIQFMNKAAERKTGWSINLCRGMNFDRLWSEADNSPTTQHFRNAIHKALSGYQKHSENTITTLYHDESGVSVSCRLTALLDRLSRPQGAVLVFNELSELLQLKREYEQTIADHRQLSHVVEETANEVYVVEPLTFRITMMNRTARTNLGYSLEESKQLTLHETIDSFQETFPPELLDGVTSNRMSRTVIDTMHRRKDGSLYPTETRLHYIPDETPPYFALIAQDMTDRRRQMQDLLLRDRAIAALDVGVFIMEQEKKRLLYVNTAMTSITGYRSDELLGNTLETFTGNEADTGPVEQLLAQHGSRPLQQFDLICRRKNASSYAAELSLSHIRDITGKATHCIGIMEDVTSRKSAEERLRHAQKFDAIGRLSGGIAHDFNNLLNIISGRLEFLSNMADDETQRLHVQEAERAAEMGARLTRRLLAFARQSPLEPSIINLNRLVVETLSILQTSLNNRVSVTSDLETELWQVHTDRSEIENAVINLTINARDAMPAGGTIIIRTDNVSLLSPADQNLSLTPGDYVSLSVTDTGSGIDKETLSQIFEPFFTTKDPGKGTGLGLASLFGFVRQSRGDVVAESAVGTGTSITIYLPRYASPPPSETATPARHRSGGTGRPDTPARLRLKNMALSVLVVEDNQQVLELTEARLRLLGLSVTSIRTGADAIDYIDIGHDHDLLFCDVALENGIRGYEVAKRMQQQDRRCRILLTSGFSESMLTDEHESDFPVLQKPYGVDALAEAILELFADETSDSH